MTLLQGETNLRKFGVGGDGLVMNGSAIHIPGSIPNYQAERKVAFITLEA